MAGATLATTTAGAAQAQAAPQQATSFTGKLVIIIPYVFLLVFFLVPFFIVFKISLSQTAIAMPPYTPALDFSGGISGIIGQLKELNFDNYIFLTEDPLYINAYLTSVIVAGISTLLTLLVGYPIAYGMARAPATLRPTLLMLVILPFWTSFLIRVYAWIGILKPEGLLNQLLLSTGIISEPLIILNTYTAIFIGIVYSYLPFMVLPLYSALEKMDYSLVEAAQDLAARRSPPSGRSPSDVAARRAGRQPAGLHPGRRRIRHSGPARWLADADDRSHAVERVQRQPRLAGVLGGGGAAAAGADRPNCHLPARPGARSGTGALT